MAQYGSVKENCGDCVGFRSLSQPTRDRFLTLTEPY